MTYYYMIIGDGDLNTYLRFTEPTLKRTPYFNSEERSLAISATVWGLGPERPSARLLCGFLENQGNEEAKQERCVQSKSWK